MAFANISILFNSQDKLVWDYHLQSHEIIILLFIYLSTL